MSYTQNNHGSPDAINTIPRLFAGVLIVGLLFSVAIARAIRWFFSLLF